MFDKWLYVQKRGHKYGLQVPVPQELRATLGKREITKSLGTGEPNGLVTVLFRMREGFS